MFAIGVTMGLAEWIIDDSCLVLIVILVFVQYVTELAIRDQADADKIIGYLYLFLSDTLTGDSNQKLVTYSFELIESKVAKSADYKDVYQFACDNLYTSNGYECDLDDIINLEHSSVTTPYYMRGFSENW